MLPPPRAPTVQVEDRVNLLLEELDALGNRYDEAPLVHDCSELADLIVRYATTIGDVLLLGFWTDPQDNRTYVIRSASFLIHGGNYRTIDTMFPRRVGSPISSIEAELDFLPPASCSETRPNVRCHFIHHGNIDRLAAVRFSIASIYQRFLLSSQNFANFVDGQIYRRSKPDKSDFHPRFRTYSEISDAVEENYSVASSYFVFVGSRDAKKINPEDLRHPDGSGIDGIVSFYADPTFQQKLEISIHLKQSIVGATEDKQYHYCLFPAFDPSIRKSPIEGVLIIWSPKTLTLPTYRASATWLKEFSALRHIKKANFLSELRQRIEQELRRMTESELPGRKERQRSVERIGDFLCKSLCELTNAEAATLRLRHDTQRLLRLYGWHSTPLASEGRPMPDIELDSWPTSAIAFSFRYDSSEPSLHFANVDDIPKAYRAKGLSNILRHWKATRSEAVIRIQRGGLLAAALNVESPIEGAFGDELEFLESCATVMSDYLTRLEAVGDRGGLATMADTQLAIHSIKSFISNWKPPSGRSINSQTPGVSQAIYICKRLQQNVVPRPAGAMIGFADTNVDLRDSDSIRLFNRVLRNRFKKYLDETGSETKLSSVLVGKIPTRFPASDLASLVVIMDSIWGNMIRHTQLQKNRVAFEELCQPFGKKRRVLVIYWSAPSRLPKSIDRDQLFLRPIVLNDGHHFGFFLMGVHTRLLGGHVEYEEHPLSRGGFSIRAFIPYEPTSTGSTSDDGD